MDHQPCQEGLVAQSQPQALHQADGLVLHGLALVIAVLGHCAGHGGVLLDQQNSDQHGQGQGCEPQTDLPDIDLEADKHGDQGVGDGVLDGVEGGFPVGQHQAVVIGGGDLRIAAEEGVDGQGEEGDEEGQQDAEPDAVGDAVLFLADGEAEEHIGQGHDQGAHDDGGTALAPGGLQVLDDMGAGHLSQTVHQGGDGLQDAEQAYGDDRLVGEGPILHVHTETLGLQRIHQIDTDDGAEHAGAEGCESVERDLPALELSHDGPLFFGYLLSKNAAAFLDTL